MIETFLDRDVLPDKNKCPNCGQQTLEQNDTEDICECGYIFWYGTIE